MRHVTHLLLGLCLVVSACSGEGAGVGAQIPSDTTAVAPTAAPDSADEPVTVATGEKVRENSVPWGGLTVGEPPNTVTLTFLGGPVGDLNDNPCAGEYEVEVAETDAVVRITIHALALDAIPPAPCLLPGTDRQITVELVGPIAGRAVTDGHDESTRVASDPAAQPPESTVATDQQTPDEAWSAAESTRDVANYLEALRQGAYEQAAWPAYGNGVVFDDQRADETAAEFLARTCGADLCNGPYLIRGQAGVVSPDTQQGLASVTVAHLEAGERSVIFLFTFEGQRMVAALPPLVSSANDASLRESLFENAAPQHVVVERFDAFEIWDGAATTWVTHWHAEDATQIEGDFVATSAGAFAVSDPQQVVAEQCSQLMERDGAVLVFESCGETPWALTNASTGETVDPPIPFQALSDGNSLWFAERGGTVLRGQRDAEGNINELATLDGLDMLAGDYASQVVVSADGAHIAYVDHNDLAASSHFFSPVVVVRSVATGDEVGRWELNGSVTCLDFAIEWIVACEADDTTLPSGAPDQVGLVALNPVTGDLNRVITATRVFLPAVPPTPNS